APARRVPPARRATTGTTARDPAPRGLGLLQDRRGVGRGARTGRAGARLDPAQPRGGRQRVAPVDRSGRADRMTRVDNPRGAPPPHANLHNHPSPAGSGPTELTEPADGFAPGSDGDLDLDATPLRKAA